jgi:hypothetical protein
VTLSVIRYGIRARSAAALVAGVVLLGEAAFAQEDTSVNSQLWLDFIVDKRFSSKASASLLASPRVLLTGSDWWRFDLRPVLDYRIQSWIDVPVGVVFSWTKQLEDVNSFELRPFVGLRFRWSPWARYGFRSYSRLEYRHFTYSDDTSSTDWRLRSRLEADIAINHASLIQDRTLHFFTDVELFSDPADDVAETFASRWRFRFGLGYRYNFAWRFHFVYTIQRSLNTVGQEFETTDNIFRFRASYFIPQRTR